MAKWLIVEGIILDNDHYHMAFYKSCSHGHVETAKWLFEFNVDIEEIYETFKVSCKKGHIEIAKLLVELGVDVHYKK
jgi:hypothetical protein